MNKSSLQNVTNSILALSQAKKDFFAALESGARDGTRFDFSQLVPGTETSLGELQTALGYLIDGFKGLENAKAAFLLPTSQLSSFANNVQNVAGHLNSFLSTLSGHGGFGSVANKDSFILTAINGTQISVAQYVQQSVNPLDAALSSWITLRSVVAAPRYRDLNETLSVLSIRRSELSDEIEKIKILRKGIESSNNSIAENKKRSDALVSDLSQAKEDSEKHIAEIERLKSESNDRGNEIAEAYQKAVELEAKVSAYSIEFSKFQTAIDRRNIDYLEGTKFLKELTEQLEAKNAEISRVTKTAEDMLKGATNAGLASTFSKQAEKIGREVASARIGFYISIALLAFLSLPIVFYILRKEFILLIGKNFAPDIAKMLNVNTTSQPAPDSMHIIGQVLARALLLVPGIWLVRFSASRHERLFRLREHYEYKYSVASSVEGFKKQAPTYEDEIAAATYFELTFNPANSMETKSPEARHPNKLMEKLISALEGRSQKSDTA